MFTAYTEETTPVALDLVALPRYSGYVEMAVLDTKYLIGYQFQDSAGATPVRSGVEWVCGGGSYGTLLPTDGSTMPCSSADLSKAQVLGIPRRRPMRAPLRSGSRPPPPGTER